MENKMNLFKTKEGKLKNRYFTVFNYLNSGNKKFYLKYWTGSNRHRTLIDGNYYKMKEVLRQLNISYKEGNDAPRGGVTGDYILITSRKNNKNYKMILENKNNWIEI